MSQISNLVRGASLSKLADSVTGFNANIVAAIATGNYGTEPATAIDFVSIGKSFFVGQLTPGEIDDSTPSVYPMGFIYTTRTRSTKAQKFNLFSGMVEIGLEFVVEWPQSRATPNFELRGELYEDAVIKTFNDPSFTPFLPVTVSYDGDITMSRSKVSEAGENWQQTFIFRLAFAVNTN